MSDMKLLGFVPSLDPATRAYCGRREQKFPYFRDGYVDMNLGRHIEYTDAIRSAAESFAIADAKGVVQATYRTMARANEAMENARPRFIADLDLDTDDEPVEATKPAKASATA